MNSHETAHRDYDDFIGNPDLDMQDGLLNVGEEERDRDPIVSQANIVGKQFYRWFANIKRGAKVEGLMNDRRKEIIPGFDNMLGVTVFEPRKKSSIDHTILPELDEANAVVIYGPEDQGRNSWFSVNKRKTSCKHLRGKEKQEEKPIQSVDELPEIPF